MANPGTTLADLRRLQAEQELLGDPRQRVSVPVEPGTTPGQALARIADIDKMFEDATGWGSWMVMCANERERLVDWLNTQGVAVSHKYLARTESGERVD